MSVGELSADVLRHVLEYNSDTGVFIWMHPTGRRRGAGMVAGTVSHYGYIVIRVGNHDYQAHRLAWLYMTGQWPQEQVDHANGKRADNRWLNLRAASPAENARNANGKGAADRGVRRRGNTYTAQITHNRQYLHLGTFKLLAEAKAAYAKAAVELHGEFARTA